VIPILGREEASTVISFLPFIRLSLKQACEQSNTVRLTCNFACFILTFSYGAWGGTPLMVNTGRFHPKGIPFLGFRYIKG